MQQVELVTALVSVPDKTIRAMAEGLDRITISLHAASDPEFQRIYRYGSFAEFERKLDILDEVRRERGGPVVDLCFVAMESNLPSLDAQDCRGRAQNYGRVDRMAQSRLDRDVSPGKRSTG